MIDITVTMRTGQVEMLRAEEGRSVMEAIRAGGLGELLALCGGMCSCATCHVYVDPAFLPLLSPWSSDEEDLLDMSSHRTEQSRLSCQLKCAPALDGLRVRIAPEE